MMYTTWRNGGYANRRDDAVQAFAAATRALKRASASPVVSARGTRMKLPASRASVYVSPAPWLRRAEGGWGPLGFGTVPRPLALATTSASFTGSTAVVYQPAGIRPLRRSLPCASGTFDVCGVRSNTATAFASASATNSRDPSADRARPFGVEPSLGPAGGGSRSRATTRRRWVSSTATWSVLPDAIYKRDPSGFSRSAEGCRATGMRPALCTQPPPPDEKTATVLPPHADT